jgi:hypothetical protein
MGRADNFPVIGKYTESVTYRWHAAPLIWADARVPGML